LGISAIVAQTKQSEGTKSYSVQYASAGLMDGFHPPTQESTMTQKQKWALIRNTPRNLRRGKYLHVSVELTTDEKGKTHKSSGVTYRKANKS
jgi:hypothetical protein